jgi:hypothetical protein
MLRYSYHVISFRNNPLPARLAPFVDKVTHFVVKNCTFKVHTSLSYDNIALCLFVCKA